MIEGNIEKILSLFAHIYFSYLIVVSSCVLVSSPFLLFICSFVLVCSLFVCVEFYFIKHICFLINILNRFLF